jgi:hypothetical protein
MKEEKEGLSGSGRGDRQIAPRNSVKLALSRNYLTVLPARHRAAISRNAKTPAPVTLYSSGAYTFPEPILSRSNQNPV